jgi:hypothetical protein
MRVVHAVSGSFTPAHASRVRSFIQRLDGDGPLACEELPAGRRGSTRADLIDRLWSLNPDLVHVHGSDAVRSILRAASWLNVPVVLSPAFGDPPCGAKLVRRLLGGTRPDWLARGCAGLIFASEGECAAWRRADGFGRSGIQAICAVPAAASIDQDSLDAEYNRDHRLIVLGCGPASRLGRLADRVRAELAGTGFRFDRAADPGIVRRAGVFMAADVGDRDLGLLSTALAAGVPVIARAASAAAALVGGCGGLVIGDSLRELRDAIAASARASRDHERPAAAARALAFRLFGETGAIAVHLDLYERVLVRAAGGRPNGILTAGSAPPQPLAAL